MNDPTIRTARADELSVLVAIDDDAATLYAEHGLDLLLPETHPFTVAECALWRGALERGSVYFALEGAGEPIGFAALALLDGAAYLDQLSVLRRAMRRGVGRRLLEVAIDWARAEGQRALTLTTYRHLPFNRPFYERCGFRVLGDDEVTAGLERHLEEQRRYLPMPGERVAMGLDLVAHPRRP
jgi:GNAT superfamily N-acetyltransferase